MAQRTVTIASKVGLHARPAAMFVQAAAETGLDIGEYRRIVHKVQTGIIALSAPAERLGSTHPDVIAGLGSLYADTVSTLRPRVMVQGNPHYLGQAGVVAEVRALLLAALRSAVLWRQNGGSLWDFAFKRRDMAAAIDALLR